MLTLYSSGMRTVTAAGMAFLLMLPFHTNRSFYEFTVSASGQLSRMAEAVGAVPGTVFSGRASLNEARRLTGDLLAEQAELLTARRETLRTAAEEAETQTLLIEEERRIVDEAVITEKTGSEEADGQASELQTVAACSAQDYEVLKRIVQAEAGNCDLQGKILVANVVMNRVKSGDFPDTVTDVVYQKSQFSPVANGSIDRCSVTAETVEAVDRALAGEDYSQGALYFMNRSASHSGNVSWFDRHLTYLFRYGGHEFFR